MIYLNLMELLNLYNISIGLIIYLNLCILKVIDMRERDKLQRLEFKSLYLFVLPL